MLILRAEGTTNLLLCETNDHLQIYYRINVYLYTNRFVIIQANFEHHKNEKNKCASETDIGIIVRLDGDCMHIQVFAYRQIYFLSLKIYNLV